MESRSFTYTPFGEVAQVDECIDGETFSTNYEYDELGRQSLVTYPKTDETTGSRFAVEYHYTQLGFLQYVADPSDHAPYWVAKAMNAAGQVTSEYTRNGVETVSTRNPSTGWLMDATTTAVADNNTMIQKWTNTYDEVGNLRSRARSQPTNLADSTESFGYDSLDRLTSSEVKIPSEKYDAAESYSYDELGNLTQKGGKTYTYTGCTTGGGPHAVCTVDGSPGYSYDQNGNMVIGNGRTVTYNPFNKVSHIKGKPSVPDGPAPTVDFMYGADGNRVVQLVGTTGGETARTVYVGMGGTGKTLYERTKHGTGETEHVQFLYAGGTHGGNAFALRVVQAGSNPGTDATGEMRYQHFDHLGSVTASTDKNGRVVGALGGSETTVLGYDAWGARRAPDGRPATTALTLQAGHREFTGHETIPSVGLVNMNGRVYDPELGRFLTPDPTVQFVADLQSYNRYSYVLNNPLRYTDPTGYFIGGWFDTLVNLTIGLTGIAVCTWTGGVGCGIAFTLAATIYNTTSMLVAGVPFDQVLGTMFVGFVAGQFGGAAAEALGKTMAGQIVGGAIAGAISAGITTVAYHGSLASLGQNMFLAASTGALSAALAWALQPTNPVSQASEERSQGGGQQGVRTKGGSYGEGVLWSTNDDGEIIAAVARSKVGSEDYLQSNANDNYAAGTNKCNKLPADVVEESGLPRPRVPRSGLLGWLGFTRDATANEWADPSVKIPGWSSPHSVDLAQEGDVIAQQHNSDGPWGHVGIVVGPGQTVSVNSSVQPAGLVSNNDWGFRPPLLNGEAATDPPPVVRTYLGVQ